MARKTWVGILSDFVRKNPRTSAMIAFNLGVWAAQATRKSLRNTDLSVTEICLEVGFQSLGSFSTAFHKVAGMTPTAYRAIHTGHAPHIPGCWAAQWTRPNGARMEKRAPTGRDGLHP